MEEKQRLKEESEKVIESETINDIEVKRMEGPDVGWAWVVAFAACMINFIQAGLGRMSGILFVAFIEIFDVDRKSASMPFSVRSSARNLFGPVVGILGQKYGTRKVIISGGIIGTLSAAACFYTPDITWITVLWGGVNGLATALTVTLPQVVISQYFVKHRTTASGIAFSGGCVGSFLFPVLLEYLLHTYGIQGTFLVIGAIVMHTIPAALILRKPPWLKQQQQTKTETLNTKLTESLNNLIKEEGSEVAIKKSRVSTVSECCTPQKMSVDSKQGSFTGSGVFNSIRRMSVRSVNECTPKRSTPRASIKGSDAYPNVNILKENHDLVVKLFNIKNSNENCSLTDNNSKDIMRGIENLCSSLHLKQVSQYHMNIKQLDSELCKEKKFGKLRKNLQFVRRNSEPQLNRILSDFSVISEKSKAQLLDKLSYLSEMDDKRILANVNEDEDKTLNVLAELRKLNKLYPRVENVEDDDVFELPKENPEETKSKDPKSESFWTLIKMSFKLYLNPLFVLVCLCRAVHFITFIPAMTTVVDFCMDKGLPEDDGKFAIAAISMGDLLGRLCLGWITDRGFMTLPKYMLTVMIMQAFSTASLPMMHTKITIFANLALFAMFQGSLFVRHPVLISKYLKTNEQSIAMGCVNFFSGLLGFGLPVYIGFFRDTMKSYNYIFYINGMIGACVGLIWAFEPFFVRCVNASRTDQKIEE